MAVVQSCRTPARGIGNHSHFRRIRDRDESKYFSICISHHDRTSQRRQSFKDLTRLRPIRSDIAKPCDAMDILGRKFIEHRLECREISMNVRDQRQSRLR